LDFFEFLLLYFAFGFVPSYFCSFWETSSNFIQVWFCPFLFLFFLGNFIQVWFFSLDFLQTRMISTLTIIILSLFLPQKTFLSKSTSSTHKIWDFWKLAACTTGGQAGNTTML
jgi:hypothetical protein